MVKNILGTIVFSVGVIVVVSVVGNMVIGTQAPSTKTETKPETTPQAAIATTTETTPSPANGAVGAVAKGKKLFRQKCKNCHSFDQGGKNMTGPNLWGIVGKPRAAAENFRYSKPMKAMGGTWTEADLLSFIAGPRSFVADTKMVFPGLKKEQDRLDILAFLKTLSP